MDRGGYKGEEFGREDGEEIAEVDIKVKSLEERIVRRLQRWI